MPAPCNALAEQYPVRALIDRAELGREPYPWLARLQREEPISWIDRLGLWYVTRYGDVRQVLLDDDHFANGSPDSPIVCSFGEQMLNSDGGEHDRMRSAFVRRLDTPIRQEVARLIAGFKDRGAVELHGAFASRLPILSILAVCGLARCSNTSECSWLWRK